MADLDQLETQVADLWDRLDEIQALKDAREGGFSEDSVVDLSTLSGPALAAFLGNLSEGQLSAIVHAIGAVREKRLRAPHQMVRAHDKEEDEKPPPQKPRAGIYIAGEGVVNR